MTNGTTSPDSQVGLFPAASAWFNSPIPDYFPGQTTAGFTPTQLQGQQQTQQAAGQIGGLGADYANQFASYIGGGPRMDPYLDQVAGNYTDEMNRQFQERALPGLRGSQVAANSAGSSAAGIQNAQALDDQQRLLSQNLANLYSQGFRDTENRYLQAWNQAPQQLGAQTTAMMQPGVVNQQIGGQQQALQQQRLNDEMQRWAYYRDAPERRLQSYASILGSGSAAAGQPLSTSGTELAGTTGDFNLYKGVAGGLAPAVPSVVNAFGQQPTQQQALPPPSPLGSPGTTGGGYLAAGGQQ